MKSLFSIVIVSAVMGFVFGSAIAYYDFKTISESNEAKAKASVETPSDEPEENISTPKAVVPETVFEFGKIEHRTTMQHDFSIQNKGGSVLEAAFGSSSCNCTAVKLNGKLANPGDKLSIAPDESGTVMLEWTAKSSSGPFRHGATFFTNDPKMSQIELNVEGQVVESTVIRPAELLFGSLKQGETKEAYLHLLAYLNQPVEVLNFEIVDQELAEQMDVRIEPLPLDQLSNTDASGGVKVVATYRAGKSIGPFGGAIKLETSLENAKMLTVPILGQVLGDISIYGPGWVAKRGVLRMGTFKSSEGKKVRLNLVTRGPHAKATRFEVDYTDPPELKVTLGESREMSEQLLHVPLIVEIPAGTRPLVRMGEPVSTDAEIVLRSTHPSSTEVRLRVQFAVGQ